MTEQPPLLYDLTSLQKEANTRHGFSAEKTLGIAQELYEKSSSPIPAREPLHSAGRVRGDHPAAGLALRPYGFSAIRPPTCRAESWNRRSVDGRKVTDHLPADHIPYACGTCGGSCQNLRYDP